METYTYRKLYNNFHSSTTFATDLLTSITRSDLQRKQKHQYHHAIDKTFNK